MAGGVHTVLVVEDDDALRLLCRVNLEYEGYRVLEAATVETAQATIHEEPVDVVLLDVHVGTGDGLALLEPIRAERPEAAVVLFTGTGQVDAEQRKAVDGVLQKPFVLEDLSGIVARLACG